MGSPAVVTESQPLNRDAGKVLKWYNHTDFITVIAAIIAITVGIIGLIDSLDLSGQIKNKDTGPLHGDWFQSDTGPLILYGVATAAAWTCSLRAIFRIASLEAAPILAAGVEQRDLSDMFEVKLPSKRWLYYRCKMWKTSVFAVVCVLAYGGAALTYRLAFSPTEEYQFSDAGNYIYPLLGCSSYYYSDSPIRGRLAMFEYLLSPQLGFGFTIFAPASESFAMVGPQTSNSSWSVAFGWYSQEFYSSGNTNHNYGWWEGPVLVGLTQPVATADISSNKTIQVAAHPQCGPLLQACTSNGRSCYWLGLGGGNFNISYHSGLDPKQSIRSIIAGSWASTESPSQCPISLNSSVYDQVVQDMADDAGMNIFDPVHNSVLDDNSGLLYNHTIHALLIARLNADPSTINNPEPLIDLGLLRNPNVTNCNSTQITQGEAWYQYPADSLPQYQVTSSLLLVFWGFMLFFAAWPFRRALVVGSLDQWMAFGADMGAEHMHGACSGKANASSDEIWVLRVTGGNASMEEQHIGFERAGVDQRGVSVKAAKISWGKRYA